ncbi:hypothetical protein ACTS9C_11720 [Empedobacter brevis]
MIKINNQNKQISLLGIIFFVSAFLLFVFPNSFRGIKLPLFIFLMMIGVTKILKLNKVVIFSLFLSIIVTTIYLIVGIDKSKNPDEAFSQVLIVYVFTPILWSVILNYCLEKYQINKIVNYLNIFMTFGCISVFIAIWLFQTGQKKILELLIEDPNMTFSSKGIVEMKLFVYGSLIFFIPAFIQLEKIFNNKLYYYLGILLIFITAVVSGRSALLLSIFIGVIFYAMANFNSKVIKYIFLGIVLFLLANTILNYFGVNLFNILLEFNSKVLKGGDKERPLQTKALIEGINNNIFGAGHGVGVDYIRSVKFPWRYENVPFALIYRVSFFGFIIYSIPFIYSLKKYFSLTKKHPYDNYMIIGYISMLIATFTNPYLESFEFNIFYVLPFIYFIKRDKFYV